MPRTVKKGIEEARRKLDARAARTQLVKEALQKHQDSLMEELERLHAAFSLPEVNYSLLSWSHNSDSNIFTRGETPIESQLRQGVSPTFMGGILGEPLLGLLKQHLKNDRLWKLVSRWDKIYTDHQIARIVLQRKTLSLMEKKTGYKLTDRNDVPPPFISSLEAGELFYFEALKHILGVPRRNTDFERDLIVDSSEKVKYTTLTLATAAPGEGEKTRVNLTNAFRDLKTSPEGVSVKDQYEELKEIATKAKELIEQIKLLGLIPGQCEICRRLGW